MNEQWRYMYIPGDIYIYLCIVYVGICAQNRKYTEMWVIKFPGLCDIMFGLLHIHCVWTCVCLAKMSISCLWCCLVSSVVMRLFMDVFVPRFLQKIFDRIDLEKKGLLTLEDVMQGARVDAEFQSRLRVMDIDEVDLQQLFEMSPSSVSNACHVFLVSLRALFFSADGFSPNPNCVGFQNLFSKRSDIPINKQMCSACFISFTLRKMLKPYLKHVPNILLYKPWICQCVSVWWFTSSSAVSR